ncbi:MAG TPA: serine/threonine-protein kinase, partial [Candidatus Sumerlaeota bacterium]|nr:serine/threonine-protein kinase [Candidatus Sumerlaeota bacterium]
MADWNKHNMPSGPMSDPDKNNGEGAESPRDPLPRPDPFAPLSETPTIDAGKSSYDIDKTKVSKKAPSRSDQPIPGFPHAPAINQPELPPDLAESLHTAAVSQQTGEPKKASSLEDMNTLLKPLGFECHRVLGTGGMGSVFLATDTKLQRRVAIKVLLPKLSGNAQFTQMFLKEAETVAQFGHSNIVQIYSIHLVHNMYFIVMEYVEGTTIRARIKREGRISEEETLRIMDQVTRALSEMHQRGILHRDIKPQNILITSDGVPKVADFGLAISLREAEGAAAAGTPTYMAPEQARGEIPTVASDIYSLGVVMYMMLSGKLPYRSSSVIDVMKEISAGNKIDLEKVAPDVSRPLIRLVGKSLETRPSDRFKTMGEYNAA